MSGEGSSRSERTPQRARKALNDDRGSALVEFTYLSVLLLVPLVYVLLSVFLVQRAAFATTEAARQAGRAFARADSVEQASARAKAASALAFHDQGIERAPTPEYTCSRACLAPGSTVRVTVAYRVRLPLLGFLGRARGSIPVRATHVEHVDRFVAR